MSPVVNHLKDLFLLSDYLNTGLELLNLPGVVNILKADAEPQSTEGKFIVLVLLEPLLLTLERLYFLRKFADLILVVCL